MINSDMQPRKCCINASFAGRPYQVCIESRLLNLLLQILRKSIEIPHTSDPLATQRMSTLTCFGLRCNPELTVGFVVTKVLDARASYTLAD